MLNNRRPRSQSYRQIYTPSALASLRPVGNFEDDRVVAVITESGRVFARIRNRIASLIEFGARQGALDPDLIGRLRDRAWINFTAAYNELWVARRFELAGFSVNMRPLNRRGGTGEFIAGRTRGILFVEVKTAFPTNEAVAASRTAQKLRNYAEQLNRPFWVRFGSWSEGIQFRGREFRVWLDRELSLIDDASHDDVGVVLHYRPSTGFAVDLAATRKSGLTGVACSWAMSGPIQPNTARLASILAGAYSQRPADDTPFLVFVVDCLDFPISARTVADTFFGFGVAPFVRPNQHRRLSAVAVARHHLGWTSRWNTRIDIYHNPWTTFPIVGWHRGVKGILEYEFDTAARSMFRVM